MYAEAEVKREIPLWRIFLFTCCLLGVQFCWAIKIGWSTSVFLSLGLSAEGVALAWLAGPISGMVVQPVVGIASDYTWGYFGKRRPFIFLGALATIVSLIAFSNATVLQDVSVLLALSAAIGSFWALDFASNAIQGPIRSLLTDIVPDKQQPIGNAFLAVHTGLGNLLGSLLGGVDFQHFIPGLPPALTNIRILYGLGALLLAATVGLCLLFAREVVEERHVQIQRLLTAWKSMVKQFSQIFNSRGVSSSSTSSTSSEITKVHETTSLLPTDPVHQPPKTDSHTATDTATETSAWVLPSAVRRVFLVQLFTWFAWFTCFMFAASWVGEDVQGGNPRAPPGSSALFRYNEGVRIGNIGMAVQSVIALCYAPLLPTLMRMVSVKILYSLAHLLMAGCLMATVLVSSGLEAILLLSVLGIPWATTMIIPWSLSGTAVSHTRSIGLFLALMNLSQCLPEIVAAIAGSLVLSLFGGKMAYVLVMGGVSAAMGGVLVPFVIMVPPDTVEEVEFEFVVESSSEAEDNSVRQGSPNNAVVTQENV
jgi:Na+/melibiose symporter-like transporter